MLREIIRDGILHNKDLQEFNLTPAQVDLILDYLETMDEPDAKALLENLYEALRHDWVIISKDELESHWLVTDNNLPKTWKKFIRKALDDFYLLHNTENLALITLNV